MGGEAEGRRIGEEEVPTEQSFKAVQPGYCGVLQLQLPTGGDVPFAGKGLPLDPCHSVTDWQQPVKGVQAHWWF